jgi:hypothetical protein
MMVGDKPGGPGFQDAVVNGPVQDRRISSLVHHVGMSMACTPSSCSRLLSWGKDSWSSQIRRIPCDLANSTARSMM